MAPSSQELEPPGNPARFTIGFEGDSVELDALPPDDLRYLVEAAIKRHIPDEMLTALQVAEASERNALRAFAGTFRGTA